MRGTTNRKRASVLITGGNKGLGLETARRLGERGWTIFLGSRIVRLATIGADGPTGTFIDRLGPVAW